ncbi:MAG: sigma-54-dependent Fis family transcriptional regulator, partial [Deltaproteobacteria bacterium]|nr:sigma-54-dependent Fis family transcriptional regulator [Deltaproteobacteria bacterium]
KRGWKANIRELYHTLERAAHLAAFEGTNVILPQHLEEHKVTDSLTMSLNDKVDEFRKTLIMQALQKNNYNQTETAKELKIDRIQLRRYMKKYNLFR